MKLKYERQWEIVENLFERERRNVYFPLDWRTKKSIIESIFNIRQFVDWNKLWAIFENDIKVLHFNDWEFQQKPFLDKMIELCLWSQERV